MADREVIHHNDNGAGMGTTLLTWLAIILSIIAIILSWIAYNRTGEDLESKINQQLQETQDTVENQVENETPDTNQ